MRLILGATSSAEGVGLAPSRIIVIETDGAIEQADTLKIAYSGAAHTDLHVEHDGFDGAMLLPGMVARQLGLRALCAECQACAIKKVCGGGLYAHRYRPGNGFAKSDHSDIAAEVLQAVTVVVPLVPVPGGHISSSSSATFGAVALSEPPDPYTCAETFAHEMQHLKLSALLDVVALTLPDDGRRFYAPWRNDPRPVGALLQGAYAFLGVSGFWRRQRQVGPGKVRMRAETEFFRWREAARRVVDTLRSSGHLTPTGLDFVNGMSSTLDNWREEHVSPEAESLARRRAEKHLADWEAANGPVCDGERG